MHSTYGPNDTVSRAFPLIVLMAHYPFFHRTAGAAELGAFERVFSEGLLRLDVLETLEHLERL